MSLEKNEMQKSWLIQTADEDQRKSREKTLLPFPKREYVCPFCGSEFSPQNANLIAEKIPVSTTFSILASWTTSLPIAIFAAVGVGALLSTISVNVHFKTIIGMAGILWYGFKSIFAHFLHPKWSLWSVRCKKCGESIRIGLNQYRSEAVIVDQKEEN